MGDRALLEKAAKAAGYEVDQRASFMTWRDSKRLALLNARGGHTLWNAEEDDGDALRLAVKLKITVIQIDDGLVQAAWNERDEVLTESADDHYAATRRAIVRAAAALEEPHHEG